jgi:prepilin-type N-terminal cleavage/methylation domain-containing protein
MSKKGFTLIELLVVVVVLATLMGIMFRLGGVGDDSKKRAQAFQKLQRIENALSGYYAAYGTYPPVPLHGSHSIYLEVNDHGIQIPDRENVVTASDDNFWKQVNAACRAQPLRVSFPFNKRIAENVIPAISEACKTLAQEDMQRPAAEQTYAKRADVFMSGFDGLAQNPGRFGSALNSEEWQEIQLFKFGLMSFLLPRNLFMLEGDPILYDSCMQWKKNNALPSQANGQPFTSWAEVQRVLGCGENATDSGNNFSSEEEAFLLYNQFSQAVCARWMENFKGIVIGGKEFYGISTAEGEHNNSYIKVNYNMDIYSPGDAASNSSSQQYILNYMTIHDPWENDFYYYSPPPYQSYRLWSAGPNQKTFPPWMNIEDLQVSDRQTVLKWMADDIVFMND